MSFFEGKLFLFSFRTSICRFLSSQIYRNFRKSQSRIGLLKDFQEFFWEAPGTLKIQLDDEPTLYHRKIGKTHHFHPLKNMVVWGSRQVLLTSIRFLGRFLCFQNAPQNCWNYLALKQAFQGVFFQLVGPDGDLRIGSPKLVSMFFLKTCPRLPNKESLGGMRGPPQNIPRSNTEPEEVWLEDYRVVVTLHTRIVSFVSWFGCVFSTTLFFRGDLHPWS